MAILHWAEHVYIADLIPTVYFCAGQESESESIPESISGNVNEPLRVRLINRNSSETLGKHLLFSAHTLRAYPLGLLTFLCLGGLEALFTRPLV